MALIDQVAKVTAANAKEEPLFLLTVCTTSEVSSQFTDVRTFSFRLLTFHYKLIIFVFLCC